MPLLQYVFPTAQTALVVLLRLARPKKLTNGSTHGKSGTKFGMASLLRVHIKFRINRKSGLPLLRMTAIEDSKLQSSVCLLILFPRSWWRVTLMTP